MNWRRLGQRLDACSTTSHYLDYCQLHPCKSGIPLKIYTDGLFYWWNSNDGLSSEYSLYSTSFYDNHTQRNVLTHWGRVTHICVNELTIIGSDDGLSPDRRQAIIWINDGTLLIWPLGTFFNEILIEIKTFSFEKTQLKLSSVVHLSEMASICLGLNVLTALKLLNGWFRVTDQYNVFTIMVYEQIDLYDELGARSRYLRQG